MSCDQNKCGVTNVSSDKWGVTDVVWQMPRDEWAQNMRECDELGEHGWGASQWARAL